MKVCDSCNKTDRAVEVHTISVPGTLHTLELCEGCVKRFAGGKGIVVDKKEEGDE